MDSEVPGKNEAPGAKINSIRLEVAAGHLDELKALWRTVLCSDKAQLEPFGSMCKSVKSSLINLLLFYLFEKKGGW